MKIHKVVLFCYYLDIIYSACSHVSLIEKTAELANNIFHKHFVTSVVWWDNDPDDIEVFVKKYKGAVVLTSMQNVTTDIIHAFYKIKGYQQTVFLAYRADEIKYFMEVLRQYLVVPIRLILVLTEFASENDLAESMETAWHNDFANILIINLNNNDNLTLRTYFPYSAGMCDNLSLVTLDNNAKNLFPKKFTNFYGCEVRATILEMSPYTKFINQNNSVKAISGIDGDIFNLIFEIVNASLNFISARQYGGMGVIGEGIATGCFGDLVNRSADMFCPAGIMNGDRYTMVQTSHVFETANLFWFGPKRREISKWVRVFQPLMSHVTPALFTSFLLFIITVMVVRRFGLHRSSSKESVLFQSFVIFMGQEVNFETRSWLINSLFMLWIWFCLIVRIAYQGDLVDGMQNTALESRLGNFENAVKKMKGYGGVGLFREYLNGTKYYNNYEIIEFLFVPQYLKDMEAGMEFLILTDRLIAMDASKTIQIVNDDPITQMPVCFFMRPGWPAAKHIDDILLRLFESGLTLKISYKHLWELKKPRGNNNERGAKPLTMETLIGCFYGLGALYLICLVTFIFEIVYHKKYVQKIYFFIKCRTGTVYGKRRTALDPVER